MKNKTKKIFTVFILGIYLLVNFFQSAAYTWNKVYAASTSSTESQIDYTNIVAVLVNDKIYDGIKDKIEWYATKYIQWDWGDSYTAISNSKALVFPINVDNFSAKNIVQLLENMYFDWIEGESSRLVWVVLVWEIPLPVVNQNWYIFPTIYPYVDFEEQKFIRDEESKYFVYNNNSKWQAEIWHWMINFGGSDNINDYKDYFDKLYEYWSSPDEYIWKAIRYEDFIWNNKYFKSDSLNFYLNNFIFAEDIWYHRYSDLMIKVLQWQRNNEINELLWELNEINSWWVDLSGSLDALADISDNMNTPTMQIKALLDNWYLLNYSSLFAQKYLKTITDNLETANRWIESRTWSDWLSLFFNAFDSVYRKAEVTDEVLLRKDWGVEPFLIMINNALEEAVDKKVEEEKYRLNEVLPLTYLKYEWKSRWNWKCVREIYDAYENYYFGKKAQYVDTAEDTSTYRWTFRNYLWIDGLTTSGIQNSENPSTDIPWLDLNKKSIWWSYEIFATQVDANRWYNYNNSVEEYEMYSGNKTAKMENWGVTCVKRFLWICVKRRWAISSTNWSWCDLSEDGDQWWCESPMEYAIRIRWWASPLNLDINWINYSWKSWYYYTWATSPVFDVAWSLALPINSPEYESNSFQAIDKYANLTLRRFSPTTRWLKFKSGNPLKKDPDTFGFWYDYSMDYEVKFTNKVPLFSSNSIIWWTDKFPKTASDADYFEQYTLNAKKEWNIIKIEKPTLGGDPDCKWAWEIYTYKTLDSRVKNDSVNADEVNWFSYKVFEDNASPSKQFYNELVGFLDAVSGSVNIIVWTWSDTLIGLLIQIKEEIDSINSWMAGVLDTDLNAIANMSSWDINNLALNWENVFTSLDASNLTWLIKKAQEEVLLLSGFVDIWDSLFDGVLSFIDEEYNTFKVNWRDLILLDSWKDDLFNTIKGILENYKRLEMIVTESASIYNQIDYLWEWMNVLWGLVNKKNDLANLSESWCELTYKDLCDSIDSLINTYYINVGDINNEKDGINDVQVPILDDDREPTWEYDVIENIFTKLMNAPIFNEIDHINSLITNVWIWAGLSALLPWIWWRIAPFLMGNDEDKDPLEKLYESIYSIPSTSNAELTWFIPWMNQITADRPIDSPKFLTFKWIAWDKVTLIYPDIYKSEIFSWDSGILKLKTTWDIEDAIRSYLRWVVSQYNRYLLKEKALYSTYYSSNSAAFDLLDSLDSLATPNHVWDVERPYNLFDEDYLIDRLENVIRTSPYFSGEEFAQSDPIWFIANMIYLQNVSRQIKTLSGTIQGDFDNQRVDFDINEKVSYLMDNYLVSDNYKGNYLTPDYRSSGYEVAFINTDWNDLILYENTPDIVNTIYDTASSYVSPKSTNIDATSFEEQLLTECNIPMDEWVLIFQLSGWRIETPWFEALECWWNITKEKPFELKITFPFARDTWLSFWSNLWEIVNWEEYKDIWETYRTYANQIKLLNTKDINDEIFSDLESSSPSDAATLQEILSYTMINPKKSTISADNPVWRIDISSIKQLWDVDFRIINVWNSKMQLSGIADNITIWTWWFSTWLIRFDPYDSRTLEFKFINPQEWFNVVVFDLCIPWTQNCAKVTFRLDIVPGEVKNVEIELDRHIVLEWASLPFKVNWTDMFWNKVWELISQQFDTSVSSWILSLNWLQATSIKISNFDKAKFSFIATWWNLDWKRINIQVSWYIDWEPWVRATEYVDVIKWRLDTYSWNMKLASWGTIINWLEIQLPDKDIYFTNNVPNTWTLPYLTFKLVDKNGNLINIDWRISVKVKNNRLSPWNAVLKSTWEYKFVKSQYFDLSWWVSTVYLSPNFSAWEDVIYISMEWVEDVELPVYIKHASPRVLWLFADKVSLNQNSSTRANLKAFDNWNNIVDGQDVEVFLWSVDDKLILSNSGILTLESWSLDFDVFSSNKGWFWHVYAYIRTVPMHAQSPDVLTITVQKMMLPEEDLNVMYLNLFGNDWWNQWWYMSDNDKYSESLIKNSDRLLTITTQLLDLDNIKYYPVVVNSWLKINNFIWNDITLYLNSWFLFDIDKIWTILVQSNTFKFEKVDISEDAVEQYIISMMDWSFDGKNVLFYIPERPDSIIEINDVVGGVIQINWERVFDIRNNICDSRLNIILWDENIAWYQVREVYFQSVFVWKFIFAVDNEQSISIQLTPRYSGYWVTNVWINWSSRDYWLWFYEIDSSLPTKTLWYKSIQDSYNPTLWIWFTAEFKNITNFGWWMSVWEATLPFGSELLINIWDPLLKRVDWNESAKVYDEDWSIVNDTEFDLWLWEVVYSNPGKEIFKVINIDFNNDELEDIIVVYTDWTIEILKNYWWTNPFQNLWALSILADRISDVSVWDVDGNWYEDILVWTAAGWLRAYLNNKWIFDVDWYPVCINVNVDKWEISEHPERVSWIYQIFLKDMDLDWALDIVTNDKLWFIKIFYWWTNNWTINYLSTNKYMCDNDWYDRIQNNSKIVYQFGIKIDGNTHVLDQSLIHWKWIDGDWTGNDISAEDVWVNSNVNPDDISLDNIWDLLSNITNFDVSAAEGIYQQIERFKQAWFGIIPVYESWINNESDVNYVEIWALMWSDPVKIYKTYEDMNHNPIESNLVDTTWSLVDGDLVRVTVNIIANDDFTWTFIDRIVWPRVIPLSEYDDSTFENFRFDPDSISNWDITSEQIDAITQNIHWDLGNARYMLDNIDMKRWDILRFSYWLIYRQYNSFDIDIDALTWNNFSGLVLPTENLNRFSNDIYPDILTQPVDWCSDFMFVFFNNWSGSRDYVQKFMDLWKLVHEYNSNTQANYEWMVNWTTQSLSDSANNSDPQQMYDTISELAGWLFESIDWKWMLSSEWVDFTNAMDAWTEFVNALTNNVVNKIDNVIWSACNWFGLWSLWLNWWWGCGLPVPFNQAFLWVWKYHVFGCYEITPLTELIWDGMPVLNVPGNWWPTAAWYIPAPWFFWYPAKFPKLDGFSFWNPLWTNQSFFRLYVMPTLTLDIWFALCFWSYATSQLILDPIGSIAWNCVVFAVSPCKKLSWNWNEESFNSAQNIPDEYTYLRWCEKQNNPVSLASWESFSPFVFGWSSSNSNWFQPVIPWWSYAWWFINIEVSPEAGYEYRESSQMDVEALILEWWAKIQNAIRWSQEQWLIDKIVKQWLDKQIKYVINNLTNFKITVIWPDFEWMKWEILSSSSNVENKEEEEKKKNCEAIKWEWVDGEDAKSRCNWRSYCCKDTEASQKLKCEDRWRQRDSQNKKCVNKVSKNFKEESLASIDSWTQQNLWSRDQISSWSDYTNPFKELENAFSEIPLVNISTQDITVNVPMLTSEDITSYISMSQSWINRQTEILEDWQYFFESLIWVCGGSTNINWINDLWNAVNELKEQYKEANANSQWTTNDNQILERLQWKIEALEKLKKNYNLSDLWEYSIYEAKDGWFYVYIKYTDVNTIRPDDVYLYFDPWTSNLSMFTSWFDLLVNDSTWKTKLSIKRNNQAFSNSWLSIKKDTQNINYSCAEIFLDWTVDGLLNWFLNVQTNADSLIFSVKENMETLQQYKLFPLQLYDWIHVVERYLWDISNLLNSTLWTLSIWMETNANRYSQYIDAIITIMTTLETYQLIIDLSVDWSESCSTCTNDNYDQFSCKLGKICDWLNIELPIIEIPSTKVPSIYLDFSEIHIETDVVLPNFQFNPVAVPLPELPNLPEPPDVDLTLVLEDALGMGLNFINQLKLVDLGEFSSFNIWSIPILPSPPVLPELPSFIPEVEMELPLLPPAPKIPELPNTIKTSIQAAKIIWKILCIVKWKIGLVSETSIKAKVEEITERDYEVPFWDYIDLTLSDWNLNASAKLPGALSRIFTWFSALLQTDQFKEVNLKWFDISLQTYINLQFNFDQFYMFLESVVNWVNKVSYKMTDFVQWVSDDISGWSKEITKKMQACVNNPISEECNPDAAGEIRRLSELEWQVERYKELLETWFSWLSEIMTQIEDKTNEIQNLTEEINRLEEEKEENDNKLNEYRNQLSATYEEVERSRLLSLIDSVQRDINRIEEEIQKNRNRIRQLELEIQELNSGYGTALQRYAEVKAVYETLLWQLWTLKDNLLRQWQDIIDWLNQQIEEAWENVDFWKLNQLNESIQSDQDEIDSRKARDRDRRFENLQNLYRDIEWTISYVDYDKTVNENNINILKSTLAEISRQTSNKDIKNRSQDYLSLITMDKNFDANIDSINDIQKKYNGIINEYKNNNEELIDLIDNDYDSFLAAVSNNDTTLVKENIMDITLSTNLFDMDKNAINVLSNQESFVKKYMDYNMKNVQWYLNALENYDASALNMSDYEYNLSKSYLKDIKVLSDKVYDIMDNDWDDRWIANENNLSILLAQSAVAGNGWWGGVSSSSSSSSTIDIANYIEWQFLKTKEWNFVLANENYVKGFQWKFIFTDINWDDHSDLIMWDKHNVYIKYRKDNSNYPNIEYNNHYYSYPIRSYDELVNSAEDWVITIRNWLFNSNSIKVKLISPNREVKNFTFAWQTYDTIKVSWASNGILWDDVDGYLVKMIHRVDQFNDNESLIWQWNNRELFDKKYILVLPKWSEITGMKLELEYGHGVLTNIEEYIWTWKEIFSLLNYNDWNKEIDLTVTDLPRNWQYSEIYTLNFENNVYKISSSSSNQVVAWPQIIADSEWPDADIKLYRPAIGEVVSEGPFLKWYVWTNYILQVYWEDNVAMDEMWIFDEFGEALAAQTNVNSKTGYIELSGLYFTWSQSLDYYVVWIDIDGNKYYTDVTLTIDVPTIEITNILQWRQNLVYNNWVVWFSQNSIWVSFPAISNDDSVITVVAELNHDIDSGVVQFFKNITETKWELLEWKIWNANNSVTEFEVSPWINEVYWWNFSIGDDIWLYSPEWELLATINPKNWKITVTPGYSTDIIKLDYSANIPIIRVMDWDRVIFWVVFTGEEFIGIDVYSSSISVQDLDNEWFWDFDWWKAVMRNWEVLLYVSPRWQIYTEVPLYWQYSFDDATQSVKYSFRTTPNGSDLWAVKIKIHNLLE